VTYWQIVACWAGVVDAVAVRLVRLASFLLAFDHLLVAVAVIAVDDPAAHAVGVGDQIVGVGVGVVFVAAVHVLCHD